jgi:hypothetical protein
MFPQISRTTTNRDKPASDAGCELAQRIAAFDEHTNKIGMRVTKNDVRSRSTQ